jgi:hypothetical protein
MADNNKKVVCCCAVSGQEKSKAYIETEILD